MDRQGNLSRTEGANCRRSAVARRDDRGVIALGPDDMQSVRGAPIDLQTGTSRNLIEMLTYYCVVNDFERTEIAAAGIKGKRLTYRRADSIRKAEAY